MQGEINNFRFFQWKLEYVGVVGYVVEIDLWCKRYNPSATYPTSGKERTCKALSYDYGTCRSRNMLWFKINV